MRALKCDLNKCVVNIGFVGAVLITAVLCFTAMAYTDPSTSKTYTVFEAIYSLDKEVFEENYSLSAFSVFTRGMSGYVSMFLPIISAFPFMISFCSERNGGSIRFNITRTGSLKYYLSKFTSAFLCGGLSVLLGYILFGVAVALLFPPLSGYQLSGEELSFALANNSSEAVGALKCMLSAFLYGAISTMPALLISSFCRNPYLITCVPFMITYMWQVAIQNIMDKAIMSENFELAAIIDDFSPNSIMSIGFMNTFEEIKIILIFNIAMVLIAAVGFMVIMNLRQDKGV